MEKTEDQEITFLEKVVRQMVARISHNQQRKFEEKRVFLDKFWVKWQWNGKKEFSPKLIHFLLFLLNFYIILFIFTENLMF